MTKLTEIHSHGVSIWLDDLSRARITSGDLAAWQQKGVRGVTTNPSIFKAAITQGAQSAYGADLERLRSDGATAEQIVRELTVQDVQAACDVFMPTYRESEIDGRVSLEVDPRLAHDGDTTLKQAIELHKLVNRPNVMIKIPATKASIPAITGAIASGISVNVTLIFSIERYAEVIQAWLLGLEQAKERGIDLSTISSVASFFVSRVDTAIDPLLDAIGSSEALALKGKAALANARLAYLVFEELTKDPRWQLLAASGARLQRPLWASTGVKNPSYDPLMYVTGLVAPNTVNTLPQGTLNALYEYSGQLADTVSQSYPDATDVMSGLADLGISISKVLTELETAGVKAFVDAWTDLLTAVESN
jgi:transaldolase